jgi:hypothetical protein
MMLKFKCISRSGVNIVTVLAGREYTDACAFSALFPKVWRVLNRQPP